MFPISDISQYQGYRMIYQITSRVCINLENLLYPIYILYTPKELFNYPNSTEHGRTLNPKVDLMMPNTIPYLSMDPNMQYSSSLYIIPCLDQPVGSYLCSSTKQYGTVNLCIMIEHACAIYPSHAMHMSLTLHHT